MPHRPPPSLSPCPLKPDHSSTHSPMETRPPSNQQEAAPVVQRARTTQREDGKRRGRRCWKMGRREERCCQARTAVSGKRGPRSSLPTLAPPVLPSSRVPYFSTAPCIGLTCPPPPSCSPGAAKSLPQCTWPPTEGKNNNKATRKRKTNGLHRKREHRMVYAVKTRPCFSAPA